MTMESLKTTTSSNGIGIPNPSGTERTLSSLHKRTQILITIITAASFVSSGMSIGHSAVLLPELQKNTSNIYVDDDTASLITSIYTIVGPLGALTAGVTMELWGRRKNSLLANTGMIIGWVLLTAAQDSTVMVYARALEGFFRTALMTTVPVHLDELADPRYRGTMYTSHALSLTIGIMVMSSIGALVHWRTCCGISTIVAATAMFLYVFCLESPRWFVRKKRFPEAERSLKWIWGPGKEIEAMEELEQLKKRFLQNDIPTQEEPTNIKQKLKRSLEILKNLTKPNILKPFIIMHFFNTIQTICGHSILTYYTVDMISRIKGGRTYVISEYLENIFISTVRVATIIVLIFCMFKIGRRITALISGIGSSLTMILLATIIYLREKYNGTFLQPETEEWVILTLLLVYIASYTFGFYILPSLMLGETQSSQVRSMAYAYIFTVNDLLLGAILKSYHSILEIIEIQGLLFSFGVACTVCTVFVYLFLPETQGMALEEIEDYFKGSNIMWSNRNKVKRKTVLPTVNTEFPDTGLC